MLQTMKVAVLAVALIGAASAMADNDHNYTNFRSNKHVAFDPSQYDVSHMTTAQLESFLAKQRQQRREAEAMKEVATANMYGRARFINER